MTNSTHKYRNTNKFVQHQKVYQGSTVASILQRQMMIIKITATAVLLHILFARPPMEIKIISPPALAIN